MSHDVDTFIPVQSAGSGNAHRVVGHGIGISTPLDIYIYGPNFLEKGHWAQYVSSVLVV